MRPAARRRRCPPLRREPPTKAPLGLALAATSLFASCAPATQATEPLALLAASPSSGAVDVPLDAEVVLSFSDALPDSADSSDDWVALSTDLGAVPSTLALVDDDVLVLSPLEPLAPETVHSVTVSGDLRGVQATPLGQDLLLTFTTAR